MSTLSERIREAMAAAKKNQADLVRATGAKSSSVANWVGGRTKNLRGENLVIVARLLNVSEAWLGAGVGKRERGEQLGWPFRQVTLEQFELLSAEARAHLESYLAFLVQESGTRASRSSASTAGNVPAESIQQLRQGLKRTSEALRHHFSKEIERDDDKVDADRIKRRRASGKK
ncbi:hypothetical protein DDE05_08970 [Streptomyces cavourensis]|nr:hypothetical protein DDE05_08970 [Streptomyces cavourensis]